MGTPFTPYTFTHPLLGPLTGRQPLSTPLISNFRSIPFASIPARFQQSVLLTSLPAHSRDYTHFGTACPAVIEDIESLESGGRLPGEEDRQVGEFDCLNLTVSAPVAALTGEKGEGKGLPVMVYVHGGAFKVGGGHVSEKHDTTRLVDLSIKEGTPVIIVSIHYRLNYFGFLACQDLLDEAKVNNEPACNFGLWDQRAAFLWVKTFISGFGGDPENIMAFGESAGSGSIAMHLCTTIPLFRRAILQSGTTATGPPVALKHKEAEYLALLYFCSIDAQAPDRLAKLRALPLETVVEAVTALGIPLFQSLADASFFDRGAPTWWSEGELIGSCDWVDAIVIGDAFLEGSVLGPLPQAIKPQTFIAHSRATLGPTNANTILDAYNIVSDVSPSLFSTQLMHLFGDAIFSSPIHNLALFLAEKKDKKIYRYTLTIRNPFPSASTFQVAGPHAIELLFLFATLRERLSQSDQEMGEEMGRWWVRFGNGRAGWDQVGKEGRIMVIGGKDGWVCRTREEDERASAGAEEGERRYVGWEAIRVVMERLVRERGAAGADEARREWLDGVFGLPGK